MMSPIPERVDVVVAGSGATGLAAAVTLAEGGAKVVVFEKQRSLGGPRMHARMTAVVALYVVLAGAIAVGGQTTGPRNPPLVIPSMSGQDLYNFYCATCHGLDAKGHGPVASALKVPPANLTLLTRRAGGAFPREKAVGFIANGGNTLGGAHGSNAMPVWGPIFVALDPSDTRAKLRIQNVVQYLESIQAK